MCGRLVWGPPRGENSTCLLCVSCAHRRNAGHLYAAAAGPLRAPQDDAAWRRARPDRPARPPRPHRARMTVSICIPTYNRAATLAAAIASAQAQSYGDLEILVLDDQSSDGTEALVGEAARADPRVRLVRQRQNVG